MHDPPIEKKYSVKISDNCFLRIPISFMQSGTFFNPAVPLCESPLTDAERSGDVDLTLQIAICAYAQAMRVRSKMLDGSLLT